MNSYLVLISSALLMFLSVATPVSADQSQTEPQDEPRVERVGGDYLVARLERQNDQNFLIEFKSLQPSGHFDVIRLYSDHVHVGVKLGQKIRLSAEIYRSENEFAEASQVLVFLRSERGKTPVWLLSNRIMKSDLTGSRYLEMHLPLNDYYVL